MPETAAPPTPSPRPDAAAIGFGMVPIAWPELRGGSPDWFRTVLDPETSATAIVALTPNLFSDVLLPGEPGEPAGPSLLTAAPPQEVRPDEPEVLGRGGSFVAGRPVDDESPR